MADKEELKGIQKAAILLIALGPEKSSLIFKHLKEDEIEDLTLEIANTKSVTIQVKEKVINEFYEVCLAQQYIAEGGIGYAKELLEKALGADKAMDVIGKLTASLQVKPFEFVKKTDASQLLNFIQDEHPQTRSERRCSYSRIFYCSTTVPSSVCLGMLITMTLRLHVRVLQKRYRMRFSTICQSVLLR